MIITYIKFIMLSMEFAFCLIWIGALSSYLVSSSQNLRDQTISKHRGWAGIGHIDVCQ